MANLLAEVANYFDGDTFSALAAIHSCNLKFEKIQYPDGDFWEWQIMAARQ